MKKEPESNAWKKRKKMALDKYLAGEYEKRFKEVKDSLEKDKRLGPYHFDDIVRIMLEVFPEMELGEDNDGQLVIYTGWEACSSDGFYAPMK